MNEVEGRGVIDSIPDECIPLQRAVSFKGVMETHCKDDTKSGGTGDSQIFLHEVRLLETQFPRQGVWNRVP